MKTIIYDGNCTVCQRLVDFSGNQVGDSKLEFLPFQDLENSHIYDSRLKADDLPQSLHLISENGDTFKGAGAVFDILSDFPGILGTIGKLINRKPFIKIAEPFYRAFARHRHKISRFLD
jgi:predicted DCC family thiol-disulfide oxidoreductase YuxK